ncbi:MAG: hypothetical protein ABSD50_15905 [Smithella sp.]
MKKVLLLAVVALFVMMPLASFAMTTISDSDLNAITAQEGVSIYLNDVTLTGMTMTMSWGQANTSQVSSTGTIAGFAFDQGGFLGADVSVGSVSVTGLLTIDVGVNLGTNGTKGFNNNAGVYLPGGINLGLTNMAISVGGVQMIVKVGASKEIANNPTTMTMGTAYVSNINTTVNGNIIISTH